ncbi:response regulator transcription factor [Aromatoleum toluolicum]|uniref:Response regulator n=1 Tax=Aromatoleum toluolicum TaxID=90060 RepID=A0ABX1NLN7_9RHOO|nr:response regulator transcription factor [Aromatoleum toluolicum]NMG00014.1 response regulator transcription factor [Aromatoleum toluolicum]
MPCLTLARPIEVLLVDDQRAILAGVTALIESEGPHLRVAGQAGSGSEALRLARTTQPHVIVLDIDLGGEDGLDLLPMFRGCCDSAVVVFSCLDDPGVRCRAIGLGAVRFVPKTASGDELIAAIVTAAS